MIHLFTYCWDGEWTDYCGHSMSSDQSGYWVCGVCVANNSYVGRSWSDGYPSMKSSPGTR